MQRFAERNETLEEARARNVRDALAEDIGTGDWTAQLAPAGQRVQARVICREAAVLCGRDWFDASLAALDPDAQSTWQLDEGADIAPGATVVQIEADARALLSAERCALNFLQLLSAVATKTRAHARAIEGASPNPNGCVVLDTRKTLPGLRLAQKYAVRVGGGHNQRLALWHGILIKENHIAAAGGVTPALDAAFALNSGVEVQAGGQIADREGQRAPAGGGDGVEERRTGADAEDRGAVDAWRFGRGRREDDAIVHGGSRSDGAEDGEIQGEGEPGGFHYHVSKVGHVGTS